MFNKELLMASLEDRTSFVIKNMYFTLSKHRGGTNGSALSLYTPIGFSIKDIYVSNVSSSTKVYVDSISDLQLSRFEGAVYSCTLNPVFTITIKDVGDHFFTASFKFKVGEHVRGVYRFAGRAF